LSKSTNQFQIIGGEHRGRKFNFPDAPGLRPTPNKVRETLFNWIQFELSNKVFLDLFAGSGALSFEAISRGAGQVISLEKDSNAFQNLEKNRKNLKSDNLQVITVMLWIFYPKNPRKPLILSYLTHLFIKKS